ncbi:MAG: pentatricopeptide repeat protein [Planctomycetota bacterium]
MPLARHHLATIVFGEERFDEAEILYREAWSEDDAGRSIILRTTRLDVLGQLAMERGQLDEALKTFAEQAGIYETRGARDGRATALSRIARVLLQKEEFEAAEEALTESLSIIEGIRLTATGAVRRNYLSNQLSSYAGLINIYIKSGKPELALRVVELMRAKRLAEEIAEASGEVPPTPRTSEQDPLGLEKLELPKLPEGRATLVFANLQEADFIVFVLKGDRVEAVQVHKDVNVDTDVARAGLTAEVRGLKVTGGKSLASGIMTQAVYASRALLSQRGDLETLKSINHQLFVQLMEPIENQLEGVRELVVVPDGILGFLPFEALVDGDGRFLVERFDIRYAPSLGVIKQLSERAYEKRPRDMLALGGALYETTGESENGAATRSSALHAASRAALDGVTLEDHYGALGLGEWADLPGTRDEVQRIAETIPDADVWLGAEVDEARLKDLSVRGDLGNYKFVHFATHGLSLPEAPELSAIVLSRTDDAGEDGYLTVSEVTQLDLRADLVTLSACETGLGEVFTGQGVVGLTQAFLIAGANAVSPSLWQVDDASTAELMVDTYKRAAGEKSWGTALTEAKRAFLASSDPARRHPFTWAPFVYYGLPTR